MKTYILTSKQCSLFKTFKNLKELLNFVDNELNKKYYDDEPYGLFGAPINWDNGDKLPYLIDSIVLTKKQNFKEIYDTYFIRCINLETGNITELN